MQKTYTVNKDELPAYCPPKDTDLWNSHPKIYLALDDDNVEAKCPYCGNVFVLDDDTK